MPSCSHLQRRLTTRVSQSESRSRTRPAVGQTPVPTGTSAQLQGGWWWPAAGQAPVPTGTSAPLQGGWWQEPLHRSPGAGAQRAWPVRPAMGHVLHEPTDKGPFTRGRNRNCWQLLGPEAWGQRPGAARPPRLRPRHTHQPTAWLPDRMVLCKQSQCLVWDWRWHRVNPDPGACVPEQTGSGTKDAPFSRAGNLSQTFDYKIASAHGQGSALKSGVASPGASGRRDTYERGAHRPCLSLLQVTHRPPCCHRPPPPTLFPPLAPRTAVTSVRVSPVRS